MSVKRVLILGGYGNFGKRITQSLSVTAGLTLLVAGRNISKSQQLCRDLVRGGAVGELIPVLLDLNSSELVETLRGFSPDLVIHTGGPFQGQDYRVPEACIAVGSHYIDLADDRRFVCDISALNKQAIDQGVLIVSGASSVPGLSSAVVDNFAERFSELDEIDFSIVPGNKAEKGEATVRGILSYTGHPFKVFSRGDWVNQYGWMAPRRVHFGDTIGRRWLANVDIPDLELFPERYRSVKTVKFQAGLELPFLHLSMFLMALLAKYGLVKDWSTLTKPIFKTSNLFDGLGTDIGGMQVNLLGLDTERNPLKIKWTLVAKNGVGPNIPTFSAIILAKKLISGEMKKTGALPCLGMYALDDFDQEAAALGIYHEAEINIG